VLLSLPKSRRIKGELSSHPGQNSRQAVVVDVHTSLELAGLNENILEDVDAQRYLGPPDSTGFNSLQERTKNPGVNVFATP
jgi:hypothetical protein